MFSYVFCVRVGFFIDYKLMHEWIKWMRQRPSTLTSLIPSIRLDCRQTRAYYRQMWVVMNWCNHSFYFSPIQRENLTLLLTFLETKWNGIFSQLNTLQIGSEYDTRVKYGKKCILKNRPWERFSDFNYRHTFTGLCFAFIHFIRNNLYRKQRFVQSTCQI